MPWSLNEIFKRRQKKTPAADQKAAREAVEKAEAAKQKRIKNAPRNPFLEARSEWNAVNGAALAERQAWMVVGLLSLLIALASVAGVIHIGSQSKIMPYVVEVDKAGTVIGGGTIDMNPKATDRVKQAFVASFITQARMVTPDISLLRRAVEFVRDVVRQGDPAYVKLAEYWQANPPNVRAEKILVDVQITSTLAASESTWEVEWIEITRGRDGVVQQQTPMRALVTLTSDPARITNATLMRKNPLGLFVTDINWSPKAL